MTLHEAHKEVRSLMLQKKRIYAIRFFRQYLYNRDGFDYGYNIVATSVERLSGVPVRNRGN